MEWGPAGKQKPEKLKMRNLSGRWNRELETSASTSAKQAETVFLLHHKACFHLQHTLFIFINTFFLLLKNHKTAFLLWKRNKLPMVSCWNKASNCVVGFHVLLLTDTVRLYLERTRKVVGSMPEREAPWLPSSPCTNKNNQFCIMSQLLPCFWKSVCLWT